VIRSDDIKRAVGTDMPSDESDPHRWMFDCEVLNQAFRSYVVLRAWWVCRQCATTVRLSVDVTPRPHSGNKAYDEVCALSELSVKARAARVSTHQRCSEARAVREVMVT
jgi:hypothetical protein